ncbi:MAG: hypothetical protein HY392_01485 [Candidatus Diapherotrites archaeon]|nr:hypothetical protein [Candidatus Diapherotrites archaeon]
MAFWEVALHVLYLDLPWLVGYVMSNLFWLFALTAGVFFLQKGKKVLEGFILTVIIILLSRDLSPYYGLAIYTAIGLMILYLFRLSILSFLEHTGRSHYLKLAWILSFFIVLYFYNVILGAP